MNNYGLNNTYDYYEYVFDSSQAKNSYSTSQIKENWPIFAIGGKKPLTNIAAMKILEVQIPFSYSATIRDNTVPFTYTDPLGTTQITLPAGNYTATQLVPILKSALDAAHVSLGGNPNAFIVGYASGKFTFLGFDGGPLVYSFVFPNNSAFETLGFKPTYPVQFQTSWSSDGSGSLIAPYIANVTGPSYLYVNSTQVGTLIDLFLPQDTGVSGNAGPQMAKIPVNANPGGTIYWQDPDPQKWFNIENLGSLQQIDFFLSLGADPSLLNLQGLPFSIKLGILLTVADKGDVSSGLTESRISKRIRPI